MLQSRTASVLLVSPGLVVSSLGPRCDRIPYLLLRDPESFATRRPDTSGSLRPALFGLRFCSDPPPTLGVRGLTSCILLAVVGDLAPIR